MFITVLLTSARAGQGPLLSPNMREREREGSKDRELRADVEFHTLWPQDLARPGADGQAGGGWCCPLMPNKQGTALMFTVSHLSSLFLSSSETDKNDGLACFFNADLWTRDADTFRSKDMPQILYVDIIPVQYFYGK